MSAFFSSFSESSPSPGAIAMPMLAPITTEWPSSTIGLADRVQQPPRQQHRVLRPRHAALHDARIRRRRGAPARPRSRSVERSALGDRRATACRRCRWPSVSLTALKLSRSSTSTATFSALRRVCSSISSMLLAQQDAVRQSGQRVMLRHEGEPRLGALALGDVHQRQQHGRLVVMDELARIDREIDQRAVGLDMLPGARRPARRRRCRRSRAVRCRRPAGSWMRQLLEFGRGCSRNAAIAASLTARMRSPSSAQTIIGTGLPSNSSRNEASRCFSSVMSTRRPMMPPSWCQPLLDQDARGRRPAPAHGARRADASFASRSAIHSSSRPIASG